LLVAKDREGKQKCNRTQAFLLEKAKTQATSNKQPTTGRQRTSNDHLLVAKDREGKHFCLESKNAAANRQDTSIFA